MAGNLLQSADGPTRVLESHVRNQKPESPAFDRLSDHERILEQDRSYSDSIHMDSYKTLGFAHGMPLRKHRNQEIAIIGSTALRQDWLALIGPLDRSGTHGLKDGHYITLLFPACRPDRLWLVSYIMEFVLQYGRAIEGNKQTKLNEVKGLVVSHSTEEHSAQLSEEEVSGIRQIQATMFKMLYAIDKEAAEVIEQGWKELVEVAAHTNKRAVFNDIHEYAEARAVHICAPFFMAVMSFGMALHLTPTEQELVAPIVKIAYAAFSLANDVMWFDEVMAANNGLRMDNLNEAAWPHQKWFGSDTEHTKACTVAAALEYEHKFVDARDQLLRDPKLATDNIVRFFNGLTLKLAGEIVWTLNSSQFGTNNRQGTEDH